MVEGAGVVVVGSVNVDHVVVAPSLPARGETVLAGDLARHGGGKGANAAVAAARLGARVRLVAAVGDDPLGEEALAELEAEGIDTAAVARVTGAVTGAALIVVDEAGENQIAVAAGANRRLGADAVRAALDGLGPADVVLVSCEIPPAAIAAAVRAARAAGARAVLNPAPVVDGLAALLDEGPLLTPNAGEARALSGKADPAAAARALAERTGAPVVVTLGGDGVLVLAGPDAEPQRLPAGRTAGPVVDTTGAGDTFNGALAAELARGAGLEAAVGLALQAAGHAVQVHGAREGMPSRTALAPA
jgi:ribokinase